jgi:hypothetical protein
MSILSSVLSERTDPVRKQQFDKWLLRVVGTGGKPPFQETVDYLQSCLKILKRYVEAANSLSSDIFWTSVSFLKCSASEYHKLFMAALNIVVLIVKKSSLIQTIRNDRQKENLLQLMFSIKNDDRLAIVCIFDIVFFLLMGDLVDVLGNQRSTAHLAVLSLVPSLWGKYKKGGEIDEIAHKLAALLAIPEEKILKICRGEKWLQIRPIKDLTGELVDFLTNIDLQLLVNFSSQIAKHGTRRQREAVYAIMDTVLIKKPEVAKQQQVANLAYSAGTDFELLETMTTRSLLRTLMRNGVSAQNPVKFTSGKTFSMFPVLLQQASDYRQWEARSTDLFSDFQFYPPMCVTDTGYSGSAVLREVRHLVDAIEKIPPVEMWHDQVIELRSQKKGPKQEIVAEEWDIDTTFMSRLMCELKKRNG